MSEKMLSSLRRVASFVSFPALRLTLWYAALSALWIVFSDAILSLFTQDPALMTRLQTYKGWLFVLATALFLYVERSWAERLGQQRLELTRQWRVAFEQSPYPMWIFDSDSLAFLAVNDSAVAAYGYTRDEFLRMTITEIRPPEDVPLLRENIHRQANDPLFQRVWRHLRKDGSLRYVEVVARDLAFEGHSARLSIMHDITDQRQAEATLMDREKRYQSLFDDSPTPMWEEDFSAVKADIEDLRKTGITDFAGYFQTHPDVVKRLISRIRVIDINKAGLDLHQAKSKTQLLADMQSVFTDDTFAEMARELARIAGGESKFTIEEVAQTVAGDPLFLILHWSAAAGYEASLERVLVSVTDITDRRRAELALQESERRLRAIFEQAAIGIAQVGLSGQYLRVNEKLCQILGYSHAELLALTFQAVTCADDRASDAVRMRRLLEGEVQIESCEKRYERKDGAFIWVQVTVSLVLKSDGMPDYFVSAIEDISSRKQAEDETNLQLERIRTLQDIDRTIVGSLDLTLMLSIISSKVAERLKLDAAAVLLLHPQTQFLQYAAGYGFRTNGITRSSLHMGEDFAGMAALERRTIAVPNLHSAGREFARCDLLQNESFVSHCVTPLIVKGQVKGVLEVFHRAPLHTIGNWQEFFETIAGQAAVAIDNATLYNDLQRSNADLTLAYNETIEGWSRALDFRDKETEGHTQRVTEMAVHLAQLLRFTDIETASVRWGSLLHDIGKMGVPDQILLKPAALTDAEWIIMRHHPVYAFELLSPISFLHGALDIPYCHHECWDGAGYPRGLKEEQIPLAARIFAVVDVWDALTSDRPYRPAMSEAQAEKYIRESTGTHFDPKIAELFLRMRRQL